MEAPCSFLPVVPNKWVNKINELSQASDAQVAQGAKEMLRHIPAVYNALVNNPNALATLNDLLEREIVDPEMRAPSVTLSRKLNRLKPGMVKQIKPADPEIKLIPKDQFDMRLKELTRVTKKDSLFSKTHWQDLFTSFNNCPQTLKESQGHFLKIFCPKLAAYFAHNSDELYQTASGIKEQQTEIAPLVLQFVVDQINSSKDMLNIYNHDLQNLIENLLSRVKPEDDVDCSVLWTDANLHESIAFQTTFLDNMVADIATIGALILNNEKYKKKITKILSEAPKNTPEQIGALYGVCSKLSKIDPTFSLNNPEKVEVSAPNGQSARVKNDKYRMLVASIPAEKKNHKTKTVISVETWQKMMKYVIVTDPKKRSETQKERKQRLDHLSLANLVDIYAYAKEIDSNWLLKQTFELLSAKIASTEVLFPEDYVRIAHLQQLFDADRDYSTKDFRLQMIFDMALDIQRKYLKKNVSCQSDFAEYHREFPVGSIFEKNFYVHINGLSFVDAPLIDEESLGESIQKVKFVQDLGVKFKAEVGYHQLFDLIYAALGTSFDNCEKAMRIIEQAFPQIVGEAIVLPEGVSASIDDEEFKKIRDGLIVNLSQGALSDAAANNFVHLKRLNIHKILVVELTPAIKAQMSEFPRVLVEGTERIAPMRAGRSWNLFRRNPQG